jgi:hypothetical protein
MWNLDGVVPGGALEEVIDSRRSLKVVKHLGGKTMQRKA